MRLILLEGMETKVEEVAGSREPRPTRAGAEKDFSGSAMSSVLEAVPGTPSRWDRVEGARHRAIAAVKDGVRAACEISVALSPSKEDANSHVSKASRLALSVDPVRPGSHLSQVLEEIDRTVAKAESDQWRGYSSDQVKFARGKFGELCSMLSAASLDPELIDGGSTLRYQLFPALERVEYRRRGGRHVKTVYTGPKGVASLMRSETGCSASVSKENVPAEEASRGEPGVLVGALGRGGSPYREAGSPDRKL